MSDDSVDTRRFVHRVGLATLVIGIVLAAFGLLVVVGQVLLLAFAGILGAILLDALTSTITHNTRIPHGPALALVLLGFAGIATGLGFVVGPPLYDQFAQLARDLPTVVRGLAEDFGRQKIVQSLPATSDWLASSNLLGGVAGVFTTVGTFLVGIFFAGVVALFVAVRPQAYIDPVVRLFPVDKRPTVRRLVGLYGQNLRAWLVTRIVSMTVIGVLTSIGLWIAGVPAFASLGLLAGVLSFIPNVGPVLSALPGILLGFSEGPMTAVWALVVYVGVQLIEGNFITPYAEQRAVSLPVAFILTVQLMMGILAGVLGLFVATPLCVIVVLTVQELHVARLEGRSEERKVEEQRAPAPHVRAGAQATGAS